MSDLELFFLTYEYIIDLLSSFFSTLNKDSVVIWKFIKCHKYIYPTDFNNIKYGEIDNCSIIYHNKIKNKSNYGDFYGSDYFFIKNLLKDINIFFLDFALIASIYYKKINNLLSQELFIENQKDPCSLGFTDINRIDFNDYKNFYKDISFLNINDCKNHYNTVGKYESRIIKFIDFDYEKFNDFINNFLTYCKYSEKFILIISLYNEKNIIRLNEYIICLLHNLKNKLIKKIIIFMDLTFGKNNIFEEIFKKFSRKIDIIEYEGRPSFFDMFNLSNKKYSNEKIIVSNSDIIFDHTIGELNKSKLKNSFYALTRWDFIDEITPKPRLKYNKIMDSSKDCWIYSSPIKIEILSKDLKNIKLGTWNCDGKLNNLFDKINNIDLIHECLNIKSYHVHFFNGRTVKDSVIEY